MTVLPNILSTTLLVSALISLILYFVLGKKFLHREIVDVFLLDLEHALSDLVEDEEMVEDPLSLRFKSDSLLDQVLSDIRNSTKECGYEFLHQTFEPDHAAFALQRDKEKILFKIHCYSYGSESEDLYQYSIVPA